MKIACVVQRYAADMAGGSEGHCRAVALQLAARHDVTVLTSCSRDHVTWANVYPAGASQDGLVRVIRFPALRQRPAFFADLSRHVSTGRASADEERRFFEANGPETPELLDFLRRHGHEFDVVMFWTFRYYPSYFGVPLVADRAVLVPTAENEPTIRLQALERFFTVPAGLLFLTPEEQTLIERCARGSLPPSAVIGMGLDPPQSDAVSAREIDERLRRAGVQRPFVLYLGRVDPNKGCAQLFRYFSAFSTANAERVQLVVAGPLNMPAPRHPDIVTLGYVDGTLKQALLARAAVFVVPSFYESLSIALLEAWDHRLPTLVNGLCDVLQGQTLRAGGGLFYRDGEEFAAGLGYLLSHPPIARQLGIQGREFVDRQYRWPQVMDTLEDFLDRIAAGTRAALDRRLHTTR